MPGKRQSKFDDPQIRQRLHDLVAAGHGVYDALRTLDLSPSSYRTYVQKNPDLRDELEQAWEAAAEPVLKMLRDEALAGDVTAAREWLKHTQVTKSQTKKAETDLQIAEQHSKAAQVRHTHELDPGTIQSIQQLRDRLAERALPAADSKAFDVVDTTEVHE